MRKALESKCTLIANLTAQRRKQDILKPFLAIDPGVIYPTECLRISNKHDELRRSCGFIRGMDGLQHVPSYIILEPTSDLMLLLNSVFGKSVKTYLADPETGKGNIITSDLVRSLTGAAISKWVFEKDLRFPDTASTPLLEAYRSLISSVCDQTVLRGVDFAAHLTVMKDKHFQEVDLPRYAKRLATRLTAALHPVIEEKKRPRVTKELNELLVRPFQLALDIKCLVMVGKDLFECVWPDRGTPFEESCMVDEPANWMRGGKEDGKLNWNRFVKLPSLPGLRVYAYERQMVDYNGFRKGVEEVSQGTVVAKALVYVM
ncbi:hypothetical protein K491DRAFT_723300 [Lophiostoma macrostomum CBS 122681]|uniref:Cytochrome P450 n=1 Tax=Lophiostoma macrostomum CBS 122681 TaxID=1314788 RepID=A0A6A6SLW2_9PLEO|nr:hypothetical protein K491DRAFT_723300 [Lophiostoma macrostomum CBS 122681]